MNGTLYFFLNASLLVYRYAVDFSILIVFFAILLSWFTGFNRVLLFLFSFILSFFLFLFFFCRGLSIFYIYPMQANTILFLPFRFGSLISFSCLIALGRISTTILHRSGKSGRTYLVLDLREKVFNV